MLTHEMLKLMNAMKLAVKLATNRLASAEARFTIQDSLVSRQTMGEATPSCKVAAAMSSTNTVLVEVKQVESIVVQFST